MIIQQTASLRSDGVADFVGMGGRFHRNTQQDGKNENHKLGVARVYWHGISAVLASSSVKSLWDLQRAARRRSRERVGGWAAGSGNGCASATGNGRGMRRRLRDALCADHRYPLSPRRGVGLVGAACWNAAGLGPDRAENSIAPRQHGGLVWGRNCDGDSCPTSHRWRRLGARLRAFSARTPRRLGLTEMLRGLRVRRANREFARTLAMLLGEYYQQRGVAFFQSGENDAARMMFDLGSMIAEKQTITVNILDHETPDASTISVR